jgi:hypothetical protein
MGFIGNLCHLRRILLKNVESKLTRDIIINILLRVSDKGKSVERQRRKATGLRSAFAGDGGRVAN